MRNSKRNWTKKYSMQYRTVKYSTQYRTKKQKQAKGYSRVSREQY